MTAPLKIYEKLDAFYLGRGFDLKAGRVTDQLVLYDSKDLVTHAMLVGMTGSGKTGLGVSLLEEAAIDQVPALVIDPKGDLSNLLLTFPELRGEDFRPWINEDDAHVARESRRTNSPLKKPRYGSRVWRRGIRTASGSGGSASPRILRSTRREVTPASRFRFCRRLRCRRSP